MTGGECARRGASRGQLPTVGSAASTQVESGHRKIVVQSEFGVLQKLRPKVRESWYRSPVILIAVLLMDLPWEMQKEEGRVGPGKV